jgi:hypothetical protein
VDSLWLNSYTAAGHQLHAPLILILDNLNTHVSVTMRAFVSSHPGWLTGIRQSRRYSVLLKGGLGPAW